MSELSDCCPACLAREPVTPWSVTAMSAQSVRADYLCTGCGNAWFTCWNPAALAALDVA